MHDSQVGVQNPRSLADRAYLRLEFLDGVVVIAKLNHSVGVLEDVEGMHECVDAREKQMSDDILFGSEDITTRVARMELKFLVHIFHVLGQIGAIIELLEAAICWCTALLL